MRTTHLTLTLAVALLVVAGGCAGLSDPGGADATTTPADDGPSYRLKLTADANASVAVTLVNASSGETALNETYDLESGESVDLSDELAAGTDYEMTLRAANETLEKRINADGAYTYRVTSAEELELSGYVSA